MTFEDTARSIRSAGWRITKSAFTILFCLVMATCAWVLLTSNAEAVQTTRSWTHPAPDDVVGFTLHLRWTATGDFTESVSLGAVSPASVDPGTGEATYTKTLEVGDLPVWAALRAHNEFGESDLSNERRFAIPEPPEWAMVFSAVFVLAALRKMRD